MEKIYVCVVCGKISKGNFLERLCDLCKRERLDVQVVIENE